jgi:hypothetical protein
VLLSWADDLDGARERFQRARMRAIELGDEAALPQILRASAYTEWLGGNWPQAAAQAGEGHQAALQTGQRVQQAMLLGTRALLAASLGRVEEARRDAEEGLALADATGYMLGGLLCLTALGLLELSLGNPAGTHERLERLAARAEAAGLREPTVTRFLIDEIEALVALGRVDKAAELLKRFEWPARVLDRASALAVAARCEGLIAAALFISPQTVEGHLNLSVFQARPATEVAMRSRLAFAVALAVLASGAMVAAVAAAAPPGGSSTLRPWGRGLTAPGAVTAQATPAGATRLVVIGREADFTVVDNAPEGDSPGDQILSTDDLFDPSGRRIGRDEARCTIVFRGDVLCDATFVLTGRGQLTIEGVGLSFAVTGGTGEFGKAHGQLHETFLPSGEFRFAFTLFL